MGTVETALESDIGVLQGQDQPGYEGSLATQKHCVTGNLKKKKSPVALASSLPGRVRQEDPLSSGVLEEKERDRPTKTIFKQMSELGTEGKH